MRRAGHIAWLAALLQIAGGLRLWNKHQGIVDDEVLAHCDASEEFCHSIEEICEEPSTFCNHKSKSERKRRRDVNPHCLAKWEHYEAECGALPLNTLAPAPTDFPCLKEKKMLLLEEFGNLVLKLEYSLDVDFWEFANLAEPRWEGPYTPHGELEARNHYVIDGADKARLIECTQGGREPTVILPVVNAMWDCLSYDSTMSSTCACGQTKGGNCGVIDFAMFNQDESCFRQCVQDKLYQTVDKVKLKQMLKGGLDEVFENTEEHQAYRTDDSVSGAYPEHNKAEDYDLRENDRDRQMERKERLRSLRDAEAERRAEAAKIAEEAVRAQREAVARAEELATRAEEEAQMARDAAQRAAAMRAEAAAREAAAEKQAGLSKAERDAALDAAAKARQAAEMAGQYPNSLRPIPEVPHQPGQPQANAASWHPTGTMTNKMLNKRQAVSFFRALERQRLPKQEHIMGPTAAFGGDEENVEIEVPKPETKVAEPTLPPMEEQATTHPDYRGRDFHPHARNLPMQYSPGDHAAMIKDELEEDTAFMKEVNENHVDLKDEQQEQHLAIADALCTPQKGEDCMSKHTQDLPINPNCAVLAGNMYKYTDTCGGEWNYVPSQSYYSYTSPTGESVSYDGASDTFTEVGKAGDVEAVRPAPGPPIQSGFMHDRMPPVTGPAAPGLMPPHSHSINPPPLAGDAIPMPGSYETHAAPAVEPLVVGTVEPPPAPVMTNPPMPAASASAAVSSAEQGAAVVPAVMPEANPAADANAVLPPPGAPVAPAAAVPVPPATEQAPEVPAAEDAPVPEVATEDATVEPAAEVPADASATEAPPAFLQVVLKKLSRRFTNRRKQVPAVSGMQPNDLARPATVSGMQPTDLPPPPVSGMQPQDLPTVNADAPEAGSEEIIEDDGALPEHVEDALEAMPGAPAQEYVASADYNGAPRHLVIGAPALTPGQMPNARKASGQELPPLPVSPPPEPPVFEATPSIVDRKPDNEQEWAELEGWETPSHDDYYVGVPAVEQDKFGGWKDEDDMKVAQICPLKTEMGLFSVNNKAFYETAGHMPGPPRCRIVLGETVCGCAPKHVLKATGGRP